MPEIGVKTGRHPEGAIKGWETRRRRAAERAREWDDACFVAGQKEERERLRPLLERALNGLTHMIKKVEEDSLVTDLRRELGVPEEP